MEIDPSEVEAYLTHLFGTDVQVLALEPIGDSGTAAVTKTDGRRRPLKMYGYGQPVLIHYQVAGQEHRAVLRTMAPSPFGHEYRADRAAGLLLSYDTFNNLPRHVHALDVGVLISGHRPLSLRHGGEFFLLTDYVEGELYARDMERLRDTGTLTDLDVRRARRLAEYLAQIHAVKSDDPALYRRRIRDLIGAGEGIMGLTDSYPPDFPLLPAGWLEQIEKACVSWRWRLNRKTHRLAQVHGDFHPFNVLFSEDVEFCLLDRSRGAWGEPGDDVSCMTMNYLFFSLQRSESLAPPFQELWDVFWNTYLEITGDQEMLSVVAPFFAWRGLVVASPMWYNIPDAVRMKVFRFIENVLREDVFDPTRVNEYIY
ncbi:MAG: aminoglycoside phosphotransferase family protein [Chloroflexi bacterium]|nr:MAG: aminoglycoside phosphotransferase family protein [Chloroflexota bacterium]